MPSSRLATLLLACSLLATASLPSIAARQADAAATSTKKKSATPKFIPSTTQESARERERRLLRECKGRPNAGACSGYAS